jgi:chromosomal replication initiation ATPase DnaA
MYIVKQLTTASLPEIGRQFGGKHHTTVLHSINKIEEMRRSDKDLNRTITRLSPLWLRLCLPWASSTPEPRAYK